MYERCETNIKGKSLVVIADTSSFVFKNEKNRIKDRSGLCRIAVNQFRQHFGLLLHLNVVYETGSYVPYGISNVNFVERAIQSRAQRSEKQKRNTEFIEDKESNKWLSGFLKSKELLKEARKLILVADREGDIIELIDRLPDSKTDLVIRTAHDRNIITLEGKKRKLYDLLDQQQAVATSRIGVVEKKGNYRQAQLQIKRAAIRLPWASWKKVKYKQHPQGVDVNVIEVKEVISKSGKKGTALHWRIITTLPVKSEAQIKEVIEIYKKRWLIEEYFKLLKTDGFNIENTELTKGTSIRKLLLYTMKASIKVQQLKAARNGENEIPIETVFTIKEIQFLKKLNPTLEGNTDKQKNPHSPENLAFATWVIARLSGWKEFYDPKRPPGTKSIIWGLERFESMMFAVNLIDVS